MKTYIALIVFLFSTQIVYDLLRANSRLIEVTHPNEVYLTSAFIDLIIVIVGMLLLMKED